jgi:RNA polymerase sigma-70 factor (ECF subfamily)
MIDAQHFEAFVRRYQDMVFATAVRLLGNAAEAEDVAQTVFLRAFQRFDTIGESPAAAGWLKTTTRNACLNYLSRYRARWRFFSELERSDNGGPDSGHDPAIFSVVAPSAERATLELHERLEEELRRLPDHQRVPLVLFHFEGLSYQQIALTLGVSLGKVKTDIHRGRETLKRLLSDHAHG